MMGFSFRAMSSIIDDCSRIYTTRMMLKEERDNDVGEGFTVLHSILPNKPISSEFIGSESSHGPRHHYSI